MDKSFKLFGAWMVFCIILGLSMLGFGIWVVIKLLKHLGVI